MTSLPAGVHLEHFSALDDARSRSWERTARRGYLYEEATPERLTWLIDRYRDDSVTLAGAYSDEPAVDGDTSPIATFGSAPGTINLGHGMTPASLILSVGVRPTHRRRGLLRAMMEDSLSASAAAGLPLAILTASEGGIYERFGFGAAAWRASLRIDTGSGLQLRSASAGTTQQVEVQWLIDRAPAIFRTFAAQTFGSVARRSDFLGDLLFDTKSDQISDLARAVVHLSEAGDLDGFAFYRPTTHFSPTLKVLDLIALTPDAYVGLWTLLGNIDLTDTLTFSGAALDEPIRHAVVEPRAVQITEVEDALWVRVLDPVAALSARAYRSSAADAIVLDVHDDLGHATGRFELAVENGHGTVRRVAATSSDAAPRPDVTMDVAALGTLLLGTVTATELHNAARLTLTDPEAGERIDAVFAPVSPPRFYSHF